MGVPLEGRAQPRKELGCGCSGCDQTDRRVGRQATLALEAEAATDRLRGRGQISSLAQLSQVEGGNEPGGLMGLVLGMKHW